MTRGFAATTVIVAWLAVTITAVQAEVDVASIRAQVVAGSVA